MSLVVESSLYIEVDHTPSLESCYSGLSTYSVNEDRYSGHPVEHTGLPFSKVAYSRYGVPSTPSTVL
jgi:hypothetical protein